MNYAVIVDFSNLFHICYNVALGAPGEYELNDTILYHAEGRLRTLRKELEKLKITDVDYVFAEDRTADRKLKLYPPYRGTRTDRTDLKRTLKESLINKGHGSRFCYSEGNEADDVVATLARLSHAQPGQFTVIITMDRDMWQLMNDRTVIYDPVKRALITLDDVNKAFAVRPEHIPLHKSLWGDAGDCVPNAVPRTQKQLLPVIRSTTTGHWDDFRSRLHEVWSSLTPRCREKFDEGAAQARINWELVKLDQHCRLEWD